MLIRKDPKVLKAQDSEIMSKNNVILKGINFLNNARSVSLFERMISVRNLDQVETYDMQILFKNRSRSPLSVESAAALEISSRSTLSQQEHAGRRSVVGRVLSWKKTAARDPSASRQRCSLHVGVPSLGFSRNYRISSVDRWKKDRWRTRRMRSGKKR